jgi:hypothetical protein
VVEPRVRIADAFCPPQDLKRICPASLAAIETVSVVARKHMNMEMPDVLVPRRLVVLASRDPIAFVSELQS